MAFRSANAFSAWTVASVKLSFVSLGKERHHFKNVSTSSRDSWVSPASLTICTGPARLLCQVHRQAAVLM